VNTPALRVALVYRNFNLGGSLERDEVFLARGLVARGHDVHCYCNPKTSDAEIPGATFHHVSPATVSRARVGLAAELASFAFAATRAIRRDRNRYDIVDVCGTSAWEQDIVTVHGITDSLYHEWWADVGAHHRLGELRKRLAPVLRPEVMVRRTVERLQFKPGRYKRVLVPTQGIRKNVIETHGVPADRIDTIPYPIDLDAFTNAAPADLRQFGIPEGALVLLFVGDDFHRKGLDHVIAALAAIQGPHLVVVGSSSEQDEFRRLAARAGVAGRVHFVGRTNSPERYYASADMLVIPTKHDPWCIPLIEAMASGIAVVSTAAAGASETVRAAEAGIIVDAPTDGSVREAIETLARDGARRHRMGERGRATATTFSIAAHAAAVADAYERALAS
jgi:glycosyltransferase involved in cell wall biosynthesis